MQITHYLISITPMRSKDIIKTIDVYLMIKQNRLIKVVRFSGWPGSKGCGGGSFQLGSSERSFARLLGANQSVYI